MGKCLTPQQQKQQSAGDVGPSLLPQGPDSNGWLAKQIGSTPIFDTFLDSFGPDWREDEGVASGDTLGAGADWEGDQDPEIEQDWRIDEDPFALPPGYQPEPGVESSSVAGPIATAAAGYALEEVGADCAAKALGQQIGHVAGEMPPVPGAELLTMDIPIVDDIMFVKGAGKVFAQGLTPGPRLPEIYPGGGVNYTGFGPRWGGGPEAQDLLPDTLVGGRRTDIPSHGMHVETPRVPAPRATRPDLEALDVDAKSGPVRQHRDVVGDGLERDHIPSDAAQREALDINRLEDRETAQWLYDNAPTWALPDPVHRRARTTGGNNQPDRIHRDSLNLRDAMECDIRDRKRLLLDEGYDIYEINEAADRFRYDMNEHGLFSWTD